MGFDRDRAGGSVVEVLDLVNGERLVGMAFRLLDDALATSCRCLPRPRGQVHLPDPDHAGILVLVRVRVPGTARAASAIVTAADPCSGLALLRSTSATGLTVPDELNPIVPIQELIAGLPVALPDVSAPHQVPVLVRTAERAWVEGVARGPTVLTDEGAGRIGPGTVGAPVFGGDGRVVGVVTAVGASGTEATMCRLGDHLPGWALRAAARSAPPVETRAS